MIKKFVPCLPTIIIYILAVVAIITITVITLYGNSFPSLPASPQTNISIPVSDVNTSDILSLTEFTLSIAERNTAWSSYILTAVAILFVFVTLISTTWNDSRYAAVHKEWRSLNESLDKRIKNETVPTLEKMKKEFIRFPLIMADFMIRGSILELRYPRSGKGLETATRDELVFCINESVRILVQYRDKYSEKEYAVKVLQGVIDYRTLDNLKVMELIVSGFEKCQDRENLLAVIENTRKIVRWNMDTRKCIDKSNKNEPPTGSNP